MTRSLELRVCVPQMNSRPCRTENEVLLPDGAARRGTAPPGMAFNYSIETFSK